MKVQVLFFGATAEAVGEREIVIGLPDDATAETALAEIVKKNPSLAKHSLLFAVNQEYVDGDFQVKNGDELAVFTAVSGG